MLRRAFHTSAKLYAQSTTPKNSPADQFFVRIMKWGVTAVTFGMLAVIIVPKATEKMKERRLRKMTPKQLQLEKFKENEKLAKKGELDCSPLLECLKSGRDCKDLIQQYMYCIGLLLYSNSYCIDRDLRRKVKI